VSRHVAVAIHVTDVAAVVAVEDVVVVTTVEFLNRKPSDHADLSSSFIITRTFTTFVPDVHSRRTFPTFSTTYHTIFFLGRFTYPRSALYISFWLPIKGHHLPIFGVIFFSI
jgi:hypothetical protein